jgi:hypothetical protein
MSRIDRVLGMGMGMREAEDAAPRRTALVLGAGGRLGERVLDQVLGQEAYERVFVWARQVVNGTVLKLLAVEDPGALHVDDVYCVVGREGGSARTDVFHTVAEHEILALARTVLAAGAKRFVMLTPVSAFSQPAAMYRQLQNVEELELAALPFDSLVIVRPSSWGMGRRDEGWFARIMRGAIDQIAYTMAGKKHVPMTAQKVAEISVTQAMAAPAGLTIIEPDQLHGSAVKQVMEAAG